MPNQNLIIYVSCSYKILSGSNLMAGRKRYPHEPQTNHQGYSPNGPPSQPMPPHHIVLEQGLEMQHHEIRRLLAVNRRLVEDRATLQQELGAAQEQFRRMDIAVTEIQNENELHSRQLIESVLKLEADIRATEPFKEEVVRLHEEVKRLNSVTHELYGQVQILTKDLAELQDENKKLHALKNELEELYKEFMHTRFDILFITYMV
ncbi:protein FLX-like 3 [Bidens hawaiensis]|uniref:protein FLX-like 3 n=1 Tax=Bidens hawaiensis TaxID=980011 RepID=UPI004049CC91